MKPNIETLLNALTLEEKVRLCAGKDFWHTLNIDLLGIPSIKLNDGPHGVRATDSADIIVTDNQASTCFPTGSALSSSWNPTLIGEVARAIGHEAKTHGVHVLLGPGINLKRSPLGGRNFEYYSEDPYLTAVLSAAFVAQLQATGVGACPKHFLANEQEVERMSIDCIVDERALHELYLQPFAHLVQHAPPAAIMSAYNLLNGEKISESETYLKRLLREQVGFDGAIVSDWGAVTDVPAAMRATLDLDMPKMGETQFEALAAAIEAGDISLTDLDDRVRRVLTLVFDVANPQEQPPAVDFEQHYRLARQAAEESIVLLKNEAGSLPLSPDLSSIGVIGALFKQPRIQGSGSSKVRPYFTLTPAEALATLYPNLTVEYATGYDADSDRLDDMLIGEAEAVASRHANNLLFLGLLPHEETEGKDRTQYFLSDQQQRLVERLLAVDPKLIVILNNGTAVSFSVIERVQTLVEAWLGGSGMGEALINVLFGVANPSGKLSETFPLRQQDFPLGTVAKSSSRQLMYSESILIGHRYYDAKGLEVAFPFGHGLSYTQFAYRDLTLSDTHIKSDESVHLSLTLENVGDWAGMEVVQLYVEHLDTAVLKPISTLRKFEKVLLAVGESKIVTFTLAAEDFHYYHDGLGCFFVDAGQYRVKIGRSSRDFPLMGELQISHSATAEKLLLNQLSEDSVGRDFLTVPSAKKLFEATFGYLKENNLYDIILDMPINLLNRLFPQLISKETLKQFLAKAHEQ